MQRRSARNAKTPRYPSAEEVARNRRAFLAALGKAVLGVSVFGALGGAARADEPVIKGGVMPQPEPPPVPTGGVPPMPDEPVTGGKPREPEPPSVGGVQPDPDGPVIPGDQAPQPPDTLPLPGEPPPVPLPPPPEPTPLGGDVAEPRDL